MQRNFAEQICGLACSMIYSAAGRTILQNSLRQKYVINAIKKAVR